MIRDILHYLDISWRIVIFAFVAVLFISLGILDNAVDAMFGYKPWRRWQ